uniref:Uncharacterized protein n=1 Tax=Anguilla anguilla TaxID=7936 RepID=A0A0E9U4K8_ANGAN
MFHKGYITTTLHQALEGSTVVIVGILVRTGAVFPAQLTQVVVLTVNSRNTTFREEL